MLPKTSQRRAARRDQAEDRFEEVGGVKQAEAGTGRRRSGGTSEVVVTGANLIKRGCLKTEDTFLEILEGTG